MHKERQSQPVIRSTKEWQEEVLLRRQRRRRYSTFDEQGDIARTLQEDAADELRVHHGFRLVGRCRPPHHTLERIPRMLGR